MGTDSSMLWRSRSRWVDRVRRMVTEGGSDNAVLVRTSDHGDLLGAHGGLHQKWFNLYDEATRVPFVIARIGEGATSPREVTAPTSHVDLLPTLLAAAGVDIDSAADSLAESFSEVHPLPGQNLMPVVDGERFVTSAQVPASWNVTVLSVLVEAALAVPSVAAPAGMETTTVPVPFIPETETV